MNIPKEDASLFKKLYINNILDLALLLPKSIDDFTTSKEFKDGHFCTQEVVILSANFVQGTRLQGLYK